MRTHIPQFGLVLSLLLASAASLAETPRTAAPEGAQVYFIEPVNGAVVGQTFSVKFGLRGMGVAPAGVDLPATGHHHLLVDGAQLPAMDQPLPVTEQIRHFGKGLTETQLTLSPGPHTLQLLVGDKNHVPLEPPVVSEKISITVK